MEFKITVSDMQVCLEIAKVFSEKVDEYITANIKDHIDGKAFFSDCNFLCILENQLNKSLKDAIQEALQDENSHISEKADKYLCDYIYSLKDDEFKTTLMNKLLSKI